MMADDVAKTGIVPLPTTQEKVLGGHAIVAVGYDDQTQRFKFRNSWGTGWGDQGYGYVPYAYLTDNNLASDFWTIRAIVETGAGTKSQPSAVRASA